MIDTSARDAAEAITDVRHDAPVMIGGFGCAGQPVELIDVRIGQGASELTIVKTMPAWNTGLAALLFRKVRTTHHRADVWDR
jgi:3-oxoadipate CoA-transferase alpha subunit